MSDVKIPHGESASDTATLLLAAVEELDLDPSVVRTNSFGQFEAPQEVADKAGVDYETEDDAEPDAEEKSDAEPAPRAAKKTAAKKTTAKSRES